MTARKYLKNNAGAVAEEAAISTSAGAADEGKIPCLNADGVLDDSIVNSVVTSAGAGDAGKLPALNGSGKLDESVMPTGIGADVAVITASEALAAGDYVNIWSSSGNFRIRKADATAVGKEAMGFVKAAVSNGASGTVYFEGSNDQVTSQTPGFVYLSTTPGVGTATAPSGAGNVVQRIGIATSATAVNFEAGTAITLAS